MAFLLRYRGFLTLCRNISLPFRIRIAIKKIYEEQTRTKHTVRGITIYAIVNMCYHARALYAERACGSISRSCDSLLEVTGEKKKQSWSKSAYHHHELKYNDQVKVIMCCMTKYREYYFFQYYFLSITKLLCYYYYCVIILFIIIIIIMLLVLYCNYYIIIILLYYLSCNVVKYIFVHVPCN